MKKNIRNNNSNKKRLRKNIIALTLLLAFIFTAWMLFLGIRLYLEKSSYFMIKKVVLNGLEDQQFAQEISSKFLYKNIFRLDLKKEREDLKIINPHFYDVELVRNLPDQVIINVIVRSPLVQIKHRGFFLVDSEGVVVSDMSKKVYDDFIIISGLRKVSSLSFGKKINLDELKSGLELVQVLKNAMPQIISLIPEAANVKIEISLSKYPSLYVYFGNIEVRFYGTNLDKATKLLLKLLPTINKRILQVQYIDLRFKEPVVSFKE